VYKQGFIIQFNFKESIMNADYKDYSETNVEVKVLSAVHQAAREKAALEQGVSFTSAMVSGFYGFGFVIINNENYDPSAVIAEWISVYTPMQKEMRKSKKSYTEVADWKDEMLLILATFIAKDIGCSVDECVRINNTN
jgi:hypothetical protein